MRDMFLPHMEGENMQHGTFCTVFTCMDGRGHPPMQKWCQTVLGVDFMDLVTAPGCARALVREEYEFQRALSLARISVNKHGSKCAVVAGHTDCAGNPVPDGEHREHVRAAVRRIVGSRLFNKVIGVFVDVSTNEVKEICRMYTSSSQ